MAASTEVSSGKNVKDIKFLTVAEVATIMRVSKMTVYRLCNSGELEAIRVGRSFRITEENVAAFLRGPLTEVVTQ